MNDIYDKLKQRGGPAFPIASLNDLHGMTLRDWFAGQAIAAIAGRWRGTIGDIDDDAVELTARISYEIADAMLKERER